MLRDDSKGARARSARIRAAHDYEATELESSRRRAQQRDGMPPSRSARAAALLARLRRPLRSQAPALAAESEAGLTASAHLGD